MAFKYATERERRDYLLLPLPPKDFGDGSKAFPFAYMDPEGPQLLLGAVRSSRPIQMGNYSDAIADLATFLYELVDFDCGEGSNRAFFLSGSPVTTDAICSGYRIGLSSHEKGHPPVSAVLDELYKQLGGTVGATPVHESRSRVLQKLYGISDVDAPWLVRRLRSEQNIDAQESALGVLAEIGQPALTYIIAELTQLVGTDDADHASLFLRALRHFRSTELGPWVHIVFALIASFSLSNFPEVREAAYRATVILPKEQALKILGSVRSTEKDQEIREAVEELIEKSKSEQG